MHDSTVRKYNEAPNQRPAVAQRDSDKRDFRLYNDAAIGDLFAAALASNATHTVKTVLHKLCLEHPSIAVDPNMLGGNPYLKGLRLSVGDILSKLYIYGDAKKIVEIYEPDLSEGQVKEAIAFAQDFLEEMCAPT